MCHTLKCSIASDIRIPSRQREKFESKINSGIIVGYSGQRKAFRKYNVMKSKIFEFRDAKFLKDKKGISLLCKKRLRQEGRIN